MKKSKLKSRQVDKSLPLRKDIKLLGRILGEVLKETESLKFYNQVEELRVLATKARSGNKSSYLKLQKKIESQSFETQEKIAKAFTEFLRLSNLAEQLHRIRRRKHYERIGAKPQEGSLEWLFKKYKKNKSNQLKSSLLSTEVELVFTAHPTEAQRPSAIRRYRKIAEALTTLNSDESSPWEKEFALTQIKRIILALWKTELMRPKAPTPIDEARAGLSTIEEVVWPSITTLFKKIDWFFEKNFNELAPSDYCPIRFASWMGGDRDGNPFVTHKVTEEVLNESIRRALKLYAHELRLLFFELPFEEVSPQFRKKYPTSSPAPYRNLLENTLKSIGEAIDLIRINKPVEDLSQRFAGLNEVLIDIESSLNCTGLQAVSRARLRDLKRRLKAFGPSLLRLDFRQDREIHEKATIEVFNLLGTNYLHLSEAQKKSLLLEVISKKKTLETNKVYSALNGGRTALSEETLELLNTLSVLKKYPTECFSSYVISMANSARDILEVYFLQKLMGIETPLPATPLFETPESLDRAYNVMGELFKTADYLKFINNEQPVMLGYSDSAKRGGKLSSSWQVFQVQQRLETLAKKHHVKLTFFHGRGGSIGRGGGPIKLALDAMPRETQSGKIRVTEQGESIEAKYGLHEIALRTFELYISGVVEAQITQAPAERQRWSKLMDKMAFISHNAFRSTVYEKPEFLNYFNQVTPIDELSFLQIGSRPKKRKALDSFDSLRAIPWVFSWTQNRFLVPSWLGVGEAIESLIAEGHLKELQKMYLKWPFFKSTISLIEMVLSKSDLQVAKLYSDLLIREKSLLKFTTELSASHQMSTRLLKKLSGQSQLLSFEPTLKRSIVLRNKYVDILNMIQIALLKKYRQTGDPKLEKAIAITISGISAGMRNTG